LMKIKLSATFEGTCDICKKEAIVFTAGDEDMKRIVTICKDCVNNLKEMKTSEVIEKYGHIDKESFEKGVKIEKKKKAG